MNYAKAIRIARSIADITQKELANRSGLDRSYLSLIEGDRRKPTVETLQAISDGLKMPFHLLTLLATEKGDTTRIDEEQVQGLANQLTHLLLESRDDDDRYRPDDTSRRESARSGVSPRSKKSRSERAA
jgi:transcriptional regulator with XRE-family HTH domain